MSDFEILVQVDRISEASESEPNERTEEPVDLRVSLAWAEIVGRLCEILNRDGRCTQCQDAL